jgi:hypothetical protein
MAFLLVASGSQPVHAQDNAALPAAHPGISTPAQVRAVAAHWPLSFEQNMGQVHGLDGSPVKFISRGSAHTLFLTSREAVLELAQPRATRASNMQLLSSTSAPLTINLSNGGNSALTLTSIAVTGADVADFGATNTCDGSVAALGSCTVRDDKHLHGVADRRRRSLHDQRHLRPHGRG